MKLTYSIPIRAKLVLIILVFALLPMFVLTLVWYNTSVGSVSTLVRNSLDIRAREISDQITRLSKGQPTEIKSELLERAVGPRTVAVTKNSMPLDEQAVLSQREILILDTNELVLYAGHRSWEGQSVKAVAPENLVDILNKMMRGSDDQQGFLTLVRKETADRFLWDNQYWRIRYFKHSGAKALSIFVIEKDTGREQLDLAAFSMLGITIVLTIVALLLVYLIISGITDSIRIVTRGAKAISAGKLDTVLVVKSNDETRVLADTFNRMAGRLRDMIARESELKQFESFNRLSAVLTHDLKNAILSLSFLVTNMERKFDREGFKESAMRTLADSVGNLRNLVTKLADPRSELSEERRNENLTRLTENVLARSSVQSGERYQITTKWNENVSAVVNASAIERVVENLIINAIEAMPEGGKLHIATSKESAQAIISIKDSGKGMTPEFIKDRLFHAFATTKQKGIGLGLFSCRDIIEQHGGTIEVESQQDVGTEFRIVLPAEERLSRPAGQN